MKITVTQDEIDRGACDDSERCAMALAILRATGSKWCSVSAWGQTAGIWADLSTGRAVHLHLTEEGRRFVRNCELDIAVQPYEFDFDIGFSTL